MKTAEYLDAARDALGIKSDYALALKLEVPRQYVSRWRNGEIIPDAYACTKLAITLNLDPVLSRAGKGIAAVLVTLALVGSVMSGSGQKWPGGGFRGLRLAV
ncbi:MAG: helix-turn-helix transcriptional regulator [Rhodocyclales bacterium]|nr:helix-turn-helix transcriptional regulator [Rhodocyclales bacterium]